MRERNILEEALKLLSTLVSERPAKQSSERLNDSAIQTSPGLEQPFSNMLQGKQLAYMSHNLKHSQAIGPPQDPNCITGKRKSTPRGHRRHKKRPLVLSQRSKLTVTDENSQPLMNCNKQQTPLCEHRDLKAVTGQDSLNPDCLTKPDREMRSIARGCLITPLSCWSQDSNSSACPTGIEPILEKLSAESRTGTVAKPEGLWQLFDNSDCDLGF